MRRSTSFLLARMLVFLGPSTGAIAAQTIHDVDRSTCPSTGTGTLADPFCRIQSGSNPGSTRPRAATRFRSLPARIPNRSTSREGDPPRRERRPARHDDRRRGLDPGRALHLGRGPRGADRGLQDRQVAPGQTLTFATTAPTGWVYLLAFSRSTGDSPYGPFGSILLGNVMAIGGGTTPGSDPLAIPPLAELVGTEFHVQAFAKEAAARVGCFSRRLDLAIR